MRPDNRPRSARRGAPSSLMRSVQSQAWRVSSARCSESSELRLTVGQDAQQPEDQVRAAQLSIPVVGVENAPRGRSASDSRSLRPCLLPSRAGGRRRTGFRGPQQSWPGETAPGGGNRRFSRLHARADPDPRVLEHARDRRRLAHGHDHLVGVELGEHARRSGRRAPRRACAAGCPRRPRRSRRCACSGSCGGSVAAARLAQVARDLEVEQHRAAHAALGGRDAERGGNLDALEQDHVAHGALRVTRLAEASLACRLVPRARRCSDSCPTVPTEDRDGLRRDPGPRGGALPAGGEALARGAREGRGSRVVDVRQDASTST